MSDYYLNSMFNYIQIQFYEITRPLSMYLHFEHFSVLLNTTVYGSGWTLLVRCIWFRLNTTGSLYMVQVGHCWFVVYGSGWTLLVRCIWFRLDTAGSLYMVQVGHCWFVVYGSGWTLLVRCIWFRLDTAARCYMYILRGRYSL